MRAVCWRQVETTADAQRCVELLRKGGLGVATCLILDRQRGLEKEMAESVQTPEGKLRCRQLFEYSTHRLLEGLEGRRGGRLRIPCVRATHPPARKHYCVPLGPTETHVKAVSG